MHDLLIEIPGVATHGPGFAIAHFADAVPFVGVIVTPLASAVASAVFVGSFAFDVKLVGVLGEQSAGQFLVAPAPKLPQE